MKTTSAAFDLTVYCQRIIEIVDDGNAEPDMDDLSAEAASELIRSVMNAAASLTQILENYFNSGDILVAQEKAAEVAEA